MIVGFEPKELPKVKFDDAPLNAMLFVIVVVSKSLTLTILSSTTLFASTIKDDDKEDNSESTKNWILLAAR